MTKKKNEERMLFYHPDIRHSTSDVNPFSYFFTINHAIISFVDN